MCVGDRVSGWAGVRLVVGQFSGWARVGLVVAQVSGWLWVGLVVAQVIGWFGSGSVLVHVSACHSFASAVIVALLFALLVRRRYLPTPSSTPPLLALLST